MEQIVDLFQTFSQLDQYIPLLTQFGMWLYLILFAVVFLETGVIFLSVIPGDSLLFIAGALAAIGSLELVWLLLLSIVSTLLADNFNYLIGDRAGRRLLIGKLPFTKPKHIKQTQHFFANRGRTAVILARFIPWVRSLTPFVAGMSLMPYKKFFTYNFIGGLIWVCFFVLGGYFFGNIPYVRENFPMVLVAVVILSMIPVAVEILRKRPIFSR